MTELKNRHNKGLKKTTSRDSNLDEGSSKSSKRDSFKSKGNTINNNNSNNINTNSSNITINSVYIAGFKRRNSTLALSEAGKKSHTINQYKHVIKLAQSYETYILNFFWK